MTGWGAPIVLFRVEGQPKTQGNKTIVGDGKSSRRRVIEGTGDAPRLLKAWRKAVKDDAEEALPPDWQPLVGPVACSLAFGLPRPQSHPKGRRTWPTARMDVEKLARAVFDAMTEAKVWRDDGQVIASYMVKDWWHLVPVLGLAGVAVAVWRVHDSEHLMTAPPLPYQHPGVMT